MAQKAPIERMAMEDILAAHRWRCQHGHTGLVHFNCWRTAQGIPERVGFLDIETSDLKADFATMLTWCIKPADGPDIHYSVITQEEIFSGAEDRRIVQECITEMRLYDRIVGHYSRRFDIPFLRSRALYWGLDFPTHNELMHTDVWEWARSLLALHSNRQEAIAEFLQGDARKTRLSTTMWRAARRGDAAALEYILEHNKADVLDLEANYFALKDYAGVSRRGI